MDNLTSNIYSSLNQLNFSIKLIVDTNNFISKYINSEDTLLVRLTTAMTNNDIATKTDLYDNISFNSSFIKMYCILKTSLKY